MLPALYDLVAPCLAPLPVIWAEQNAPRPAKPYATLAIAGADPAPSIVGTEPDATGTATFTEHRLIRAEVELYGPDALATAQALALRLRLPSHLARAYALNLGIARVRPVTDLTALVDGTQQYEQRAMLEFTVHATGSATDDVGLIEHVVLPPCGLTVTSPTAATPPPDVQGA